MPNPPYTYEMINAHAPDMTSFVHIHNTQISRYFKRYLLQEVLSVFEFTLPESWDSDYFRFMLLGFGYVAILNTEKFGVIPQQCTLAGRNVFYRPTRCLVANPLLRDIKDLRIGKDCALVKLMPDYGNICDIVDNYGNMLALAYETASVNLVNSKVSFVFPVANNTEAQTAKAMYDEIVSGNPATFIRKPSVKTDIDTWKPFQQNVGQNFIVPELLESMRTIRDMFLTDVGIPNLSVRKKERTTTDEATKNTVETECKVRLWLDEIQEGMKQAIALFPDTLNETNFSVKLRFEESDGIVG